MSLALGNLGDAMTAILQQLHNPATTEKMQQRMAKLKEARSGSCDLSRTRACSFPSFAPNDFFKASAYKVEVKDA